MAAYEALSDDQKEDVTNYSTLEDAISALSVLKIAECERLIDAIGTVTLDSEDAITEARTYYDELSANEQVAVENYLTLVAAEEVLEDLKEASETESPALSR